MTYNSDLEQCSSIIFEDLVIFSYSLLVISNDVLSLP